MGTENVIALAEAQQQRRTHRGRHPAPPDNGDGSRPVVRIEDENIRTTVTDQVENLLIKAGAPIYQQQGRLVEVIRDLIKVAGCEEGYALRLSTLGLSRLLELMDRYIGFERYLGKADNYVPCRCPEEIAATYLSRDGCWRVPRLFGVTSIPVLRPDGSVVTRVGYDEATGIVFEPGGLVFPEIPAHPTRADALAAFETMMTPVRLFPFRDGIAKAVAASAIITAVVRKSLRTAPMHAFSAPTAGSGKSIFVDVVASVTTGEPAAVLSTGKDRYGEAELEKRLTAALLDGSQIISIDNVNGPLGGELLCQILTQTLVNLRPLGKSVVIKAPITTAVFATGNNIELVGDMTRRALTCWMDPGVERPELREFDFHPVKVALQMRPTIVVAALTIIRAFLLSGEQTGRAALGSFEDWSRLVRDPLIWLGLDDPVAVLEETRGDDPVLSKLRVVLAAWGDAAGDAWRTVGEIVELASEKWPHGEQGESGGLKNQVLFDALSSVAPGEHGISKERLAKWLNKHRGRVVGVLRIEKYTENVVPKWRVEGAVKATAPGGQGGSTVDQGGLWDDIPF